MGMVIAGPAAVVGPRDVFLLIASGQLLATIPFVSVVLERREPVTAPA